MQPRYRLAVWALWVISAVSPWPQQPELSAARVIADPIAASPMQSDSSAPAGPTQPTVIQAAGSKEPSEPRRQLLGPGSPPQPFDEARAMAPPKNDSELATSVKQLAGQLAQAGRFSGSILLMADGKRLVDDAWGQADREQMIANTPETAYDIGSIGKLFTQIAILQLLDAGNLALDEPFGRYLPDYPDREIANKATLRQLLLHRSGMGDIFDRITPETKVETMTELKDFLPLFVGKPLDFEPG